MQTKTVKVSKDEFKVTMEQKNFRLCNSTLQTGKEFVIALPKGSLLKWDDLDEIFWAVSQCLTYDDLNDNGNLEPVKSLNIHEFILTDQKKAVVGLEVGTHLIYEDSTIIFDAVRKEIDNSYEKLSEKNINTL